MYPVGLLFGLGFDTVTEVGLLVIAGGAAAADLPWYAVLTLPVLFAAGMSLLDTIDGSFMNFAYGWAFTKPVRKIYYNITVTALSVAVALVIGGHRARSVCSPRSSASPRARSRGSAAIDLDDVGFWIVGLFVVTWVVALAVWRFGPHRGALVGGVARRRRLSASFRGEVRQVRRGGVGAGFTPGSASSSPPGRDWCGVCARCERVKSARAGLVRARQPAWRVASMAARKCGSAASMDSAVAVRQIRNQPGVSKRAPGMTRTPRRSSDATKASSSGTGERGQR